MNALADYLETVEIPEQKAKMAEVFRWVGDKFPTLETDIKWKQLMFVDHGTLIIGFSRAKQHMSFTPEEKGISIFSEDIIKSGYAHTKGIVKIKWADEVDYDLLQRIIEYNITDKAGCTTFFRK